MQIEFSTVAPLTLSRALLIYESGRDIAVTEHTVREGAIQPDGKPLDLAAFARQLAGTGSQQALEWVEEATLAVTGQFTVWWTPPQVKEVFVARDYKKSMRAKDSALRKAWFPGFVWCGHRTKPLLYLWAFAGRRQPTPETLIYRPSYGPVGTLDHIFQHTPGSVCLGSTSGGDHTPAGWRKAWWDSLFKTARNLETKPYEVAKKFQRLGALADVAARVAAKGASGETAD